MSEPTFEGLDYDFLRYIGVVPENQRRIQAFYLPYFEGCDNVVDVGCGDADFVELLQEANINVVGVDSDARAYEAAKARGLPVVKQDVFAYLAQMEDTSVDGIFAAHLVEHLPYPKVIELIQQAQRVLRPGGRIVLSTPNVRSVFSHLEMFYLHFGHITFYHPRLLSFFLDHEGFGEIETGENHHTASPLVHEARYILARGLQTTPPAPPQPAAASLQSLPPGPYRYSQEREIPLQGNGVLQRLSHTVKTRLSRWLVLPLMDKLYENLHSELAQENARLTHTVHVQAAQIQTLQADVQGLAQSLQSLNGPFECFVTARKPD